MRKKLIFLLAVFVISLLVACAPEGNPQDAMTEMKPTDVMMEEQVPGTGAETMEKSSTPEMMGEETMDAEAMMEMTSTPDKMMSTHDPLMETETPQDGMMEEKEAMMPDWFRTQLIDAVTGQPFQIADFEGKVVLVETFAQWCPTCLSQQKQMAEMQSMMGMPNDLTIVSLDIDPNEDAAMLKAYLEKHTFNWRFAVAPPETAREIGNLYGQQFLNPPSAPMFVIDRQGKVHPLPFGVKSAKDLEEALRPFLDESM